jgi:hypothetical protein
LLPDRPLTDYPIGLLGGLIQIKAKALFFRRRQRALEPASVQPDMKALSGEHWRPKDRDVARLGLEFLGTGEGKGSSRRDDMGEDI